MLEYEKVLSPIAFHRNCFDALDIARRCAQRDVGTVYLLHVVRRVDTLEIGAPGSDERITRETLERLQQIIDDQLAGVMAEPLVRFGHPVDEILGAQKEVRAQVIVLAKHNRKGLAQLFIGNVAERVVRNASCTVIAVPPKSHEDEVQDRAHES